MLRAQPRHNSVARRSTSVHPSRICQLGEPPREIPLPEGRERRVIVRSIARDAIPAVAVVVTLVVTVVTVVVGVTLKICGSEETDGGAPPVAEAKRLALGLPVLGPVVLPDAAGRVRVGEEEEAGQDPARRRPRG